MMNVQTNMMDRILSGDESYKRSNVQTRTKRDAPDHLKLEVAIELTRRRIESSFDDDVKVQAKLSPGYSKR